MKKNNFFKWIISNWFFWGISIIYILWAGFEDLQNKAYSEFFDVVFGVFIIIVPIFLIAYLFTKFIPNVVKREIEKTEPVGKTK